MNNYTPPLSQSDAEDILYHFMFGKSYADCMTVLGITGRDEPFYFHNMHAVNALNQYYAVASRRLGTVGVYLTTEQQVAVIQSEAKKARKYWSAKARANGVPFLSRDPHPYIENADDMAAQAGQILTGKKVLK